MTASASAASADSLRALEWLVGEWRGFGSFATRTSYIHVQFYYDLAGAVFVERTLDVFPPQMPSTEYEMHQDFVVYYRLEGSHRLRAKGFYVEGFVNSFDVEVSEDGGQMVCDSTVVENGPEGMRARWTIHRETHDLWTGRFELAEPGQEYRLVETQTMERIA